MISTAYHRNWARMPIDHKDASLVLYLPLWYPYSDMTGGTIYSYDKNRHSCTVTGATRGRQGRTFDGLDDNITFPDTGFPSGAVNRTVLMWVNLTTVTKDFQEFLFYGTEFASQGLLLSCASAATGGANKLVIGKYGADADAVSATALVAAVWTQIGFSLSSTTITYLLNGVADGTATLTGIDTLLTGTSGKMGLGWNASYISGTGGEVLLFNRALSLAEIQQNYQGTKWRYQ